MSVLDPSSIPASVSGGQNPMSSAPGSSTSFNNLSGTGADTADVNNAFIASRVFAQPMAANVGSETFNAVRDALQEAYKAAVSPDYEVTVLSLDRAVYPELYFGALVVAMRLKVDPSAVSYHSLLLASTNEDVPADRFQQGNKQYEIHRVAADAFDRVLVDHIDAAVKQQFPNVTVINADSTVVPKDFDTKNKGLFYKLAYNTALACSQTLKMHSPNFRDLSLSEVMSGQRFTIELALGKNQIENPVGEPQRADVMAVFRSAQQTTSDRSVINAGAGNQRVTEVGGYVDFYPVRQPGEASPFAQLAAASAVPSPMYMAQLNITSMFSTISFTPSMVLMALMTAFTVARDNSWMQLFKRQAGSGSGPMMSDIGALNIGANVGNDTDKRGYGLPVDTASTDFDLPALGKFMALAVQPGLALALDCPVNAPPSWYTSMFAAAAMGSHPAEALVRDAANSLTNGLFGKIFPAEARVFNASYQLWSGTWEDANHIKRDLRDFDQLAVANVAGINRPEALFDWSDTYLRDQVPVSERLSHNKSMISDMSNQTAKFTGRIVRCVFNGAFISALNQAISQLNLPISVNNPMGMEAFFQDRGVASWATGSLFSPTSSFAAARAGGVYGAQAGWTNQAVPGFTGRYGV